MLFRRLLATLVAVLAATPVARADESATLKKIKDTGVIAVGHRESSIPFSYSDDKQQVVGYSNDVALQVVEAVRRELKLAKLEVKLVPVTSQNRIPLVQNGTVDLECGSTTNNLERQKQVAFSNTIFIVGTRFLARTDAVKKGLKDFPDLAGKNVVVTAGTTSERLLRKMNEEKKLNLNITSAKDHGESFLILESGRAVAFMLDDVLLSGEIAKARRPKDWVVTGTAQSREAYGCSMRKGDPQFKAIVDKTIARLETSGEMEKIFDKWFRHPIPPKGLNLEFTLSDELKALFKSPNDKALD
ncbi:MAG: glutamate/aspartate ABC transporter substrate-binding protein [Myxococcales bacterium]